MAESSRTLVYVGCSLDGFIAGPDNDVSWLEQDFSRQNDLSADPGYVQFGDVMSRVGSMLMGRTTYDTVATMGVWPYGETPVVVATTRALRSNISSVSPAHGEISALVDQAKAAAGNKDVYIDGGKLVRQALDADLVDELIITFLPILLGAGTRLFDGLRTPRKVQFTSSCPSGAGMLQVSAKLKESP